MYILQLASVLIYHSFAYHLCRTHENNEREFYSTMPEARTIWLKQFTIFSFFITAAIAVLVYIMFIQFPALQPVRYSFILLSIFIYWITYSAMKNPELLDFISLRTRATDTDANLKFRPELKAYRTPIKYQSSGLSNEDAEQILLKLDILLNKQQLFLDSELTIDILADKTGCSRHHLSQVLNQKINRSFYDHINYYRVECAKKLLLDETIQNHKIAAIAYDSGFNSLSTFNEVFKKMTGVTGSVGFCILQE